MVVPVKNKFGILLAEKRIRDKDTLPLSRVATETGIARRTLYAWQSNKVDRFDAYIIDRLCQYFGVTIADLLEYVPGKPAEIPKKKTARK